MNGQGILAPGLLFLKIKTKIIIITVNNNSGANLPRKSNMKNGWPVKLPDDERYALVATVIPIVKTKAREV